MARLEWVKQRLENWALWKERGDSSGLGYPSQSAFLRESVDCGRSFEAMLMSTVDEIEATKTDEAVESLLGSKPHLYRTITLIYLEGRSIRQTAEAMCKAESTVKANLGHADHAVAAYLQAKREEAERAASAPK